MKKIDVHQHLFVQKDPQGTELINSMEENDIEKCVLHGCPSEIFPYLGDNRQVLKVCNRYPDRLIGSLYVDPRNTKTAEKLIKDYHAEGFKCVKMFPNLGFYPEDPELYSVFELIGNLGMMVLLHIGWLAIPEGVGKISVSSKYANPVFIESLARLFPETIFILAHLGGMCYYHEAIQLSREHKNIYMDSSGRYAQSIIICMKNMIPLIDFDKVLWGLDGEPRKYKENIESWQKILVKLGLGELTDRIFYQNAQRLLYIHLDN